MGFFFSPEEYLTSQNTIVKLNFSNLFVLNCKIRIFRRGFQNAGDLKFFWRFLSAVSSDFFRWVFAFPESLYELIFEVIKYY